VNIEELEAQLSKYYDKFISPDYQIKNWVIVNNVFYEKYKNKLKIESILANTGNEYQKILVVETKNKYIVIKYSDKFICYRESDTEYGLATDIYELLAINKKNMDSTQLAPLESFDSICKIMGWKLSKRAKETLDYFN